MGRKNNRSGRTPQARRRADGTRGGRIAGWNPPPPVEHLVVPKGRCYFRSRKGKLIFTEAETVTALKQLRAQRLSKGSGYVESRSYPCPDGGCGGWHLTSREEYQERSA